MGYCELVQAPCITSAVDRDDVPHPLGIFIVADGIVGSDDHHNKLPVCHLLLLRAKSRRGQGREKDRDTYIHTVGKSL